MWSLVCVMLSQMSIKLSSFLKNYSFCSLESFLLFCLSVCCSVPISFSLLLTPPSVFLISIVFFFISIWLCFVRKSLSIHPSSLSTFMISTLNSFLGILLISTLLISYFGVLCYSFVWNIFLCLLILPNPLSLFLYIK